MSSTDLLPYRFHVMTPLDNHNLVHLLGMLVAKRVIFSQLRITEIDEPILSGRHLENQFQFSPYSRASSKAAFIIQFQFTSTAQKAENVGHKLRELPYVIGVEVLPGRVAEPTPVFAAVEV